MYEPGALDRVFNACLGDWVGLAAVGKHGGTLAAVDMGHNFLCDILSSVNVGDRGGDFIITTYIRAR